MMSDINDRKFEFDQAFGETVRAREALRTLAEPFAKDVLGDRYVHDRANSWTGWRVTPVYDSDGLLVALDFHGDTYDDRGPTLTKTKAHRVLPLLMAYPAPLTTLDGTPIELTMAQINGIKNPDDRAEQTALMLLKMGFEFRTVDDETD